YEANQDKALIDDVVIPVYIAGEGECSDGTEDCNIEDLDDDNDGVEDLSDGCPTDSGEQIDTDGDGFCDNADADDDNDGTYDYNDDMPLDPNETTDSDGDGIGDNADTDDDNDGCLDEDDDLPNDDSDCSDLDGDGVGDSTDPDDDGDNVMDDVDPFPEDGTAWADNDGDGDPDFTGTQGFFSGNFEGGAIPVGWTTYGSNPWFVCGTTVSCGTASGSPITGSYSAESGDISDSQTSSLEVTMMTTAGDVSFAYETSTESNWDYLRFYVDGSLTMSWSGVSSGTYMTTVSAGNHTFEWMYYKDTSVSSNADTVWVDDISLPTWQPFDQSDLDDDNDGVYDEFDLDPLDPCVSLDTDGDGAPDWVMTGVIDMSGTGDENFTVDCDASMWVEDWDDDGDGWSDDLEDLCGSNHLDGDESPMDLDQDFVCDDLDDDLDNDLTVNPVSNCDLYLDSGETAAYIDCVSDGFHAVDADGDGEASYMELMHAWTFQWASDGDDGDDMDGMVTFFCGDGSEIPFEWVNDEIDDCEDGADEQQFDENGEPINWFDCYDGTQVWINQVNDGYPDCPDGDDEMPDDDWDDEGDDDWDEGDDDGSEDMGGVGSRDNHDNGTDDNGTGDDHGDDHGDENGTGDDHGDDHGDDDDMGEPMEPETWPSQDDMAEFDMMFWDWISQWDADNSTSLSFDEFWQFNTDSEEGWDFENPGWSEDTTDWDQFPFDPSEQTDTDMDGIGDNADGDDDNDGTPDTLDAFPYDPTEDADLDGDGIGDNSDNDTDGDGIDNDQDDFDSDPTAAADNDGDGIDDASDSDDDNDGVPDVADWAPMDTDCVANQEETHDGSRTDNCEVRDTDLDGIGDNADTDDDDDGVLDADDAFPRDDSEDADADMDGIGDNADPDDDNDGTPDGLDAFPNDANEQRDYDSDGIGDVADADRDEDGYLNSDDAFPMNENEWLDTDGDNVGDNSDSDIDGDSVLNADDWAPTDASEWDDTDGDGIGDNTDDDDDGDGVLDAYESSCGTDSKNAASVPSDYDGDGDCDALDDEDNRGEPGNNPIENDAQEAPGFTPGFASALAVISLLGAAMLGRRKDD
ncbi:MAG: hypothetical protein CMA70_02070, partial [Euryarchaeota archaeon]|nr:hypothetical protein [Euryarchaeota archaeon]